MKTITLLVALLVSGCAIVPAPGYAPGYGYRYDQPQVNVSVAQSTAQAVTQQVAPVYTAPYIPYQPYPVIQYQYGTGYYTPYGPIRGCCWR